MPRENAPASAAEPPDAAPAAARTWLATVSYDGTRFCGWERQKNGLAVQEVFEDAIFRLSGERSVVVGSGRTDAGVHALGQAVSFRLARRMTPRKLRLALNALLPLDVAVLALEEVADDFHARFAAKRKTYRYDVLNGPTRRPLIRHRVFHFPQALDAARMDRAAKALIGTHDFRAFAKESARRRSCVRTIFDAKVGEERLDAENRLLTVELVGSGFLYNMVRIVVGTLIDVGLGRRPETCFGELLTGGKRAKAGFTVPPCGLVLVSVEY
jgi:tRNA pseudouridine38-40 synthase